MPFRLGVSAPAAAGGLDIVYSAVMAETTLDGAHALGATVLTLASVDGFRTDMTFGIAPESHAIEAIDSANSQITIASPGLLANRADGTAVFCAPLWGAGDSLALPAPASGASYAELEARMLWQLLSSSGTERNVGHSTGRWWQPKDSALHALDDGNTWWMWANTEAGLDSWSIGAVYAGSSLRDHWSLEYSPTENSLSFAQSDPNQTPRYTPRVQTLVLAGRA